MEFDVAFLRAQPAIAHVRRVDPKWSPAPSLRATVRGEIDHQRSIPSQADAYLRSLERPLPGMRPGPGHNGGPPIEPPTIRRLAPGGQPIGTRLRGANDRTFTVDEETMNDLMLRLTTGSLERPAPERYSGVYDELADRCVIGFRLSTRNGTTIDVLERPGFIERPFKLHFRRDP